MSCYYVLESLWGTFVQPATWTVLAVVDSCLHLVPRACACVIYAQEVADGRSTPESISVSALCDMIA